MAYIDQYTLAQDPTFRSRVEMAMIIAAIQISAEDPTTEYHQQRAQYAQACLANPVSCAANFALGVASNPVITAQSSDSDIQFTVNSQWNAYAGVITQPPEV